MSNLLIIQPAFSCLALLPAAKALGHNVTVMTANVGDRIIPLEFASFINQSIVVDTNDYEAILESLPRDVEFDAVIPGSEYHVVLSAKLADKLSYQVIL